MIPKLQSARNDCTYSLFEQKSPYTYLSIYLENQKKKRCANNLINPITESQKEKKIPSLRMNMFIRRVRVKSHQL